MNVNQLMKERKKNTILVLEFIKKYGKVTIEDIKNKYRNFSGKEDCLAKVKVREKYITGCIYENISLELKEILMDLDRAKLIKVEWTKDYENYYHTKYEYLDLQLKKDKTYFIPVYLTPNEKNYKTVEKILVLPKTRTTLKRKYNPEYQVLGDINRYGKLIFESDFDSSIHKKISVIFGDKKEVIRPSDIRSFYWDGYIRAAKRLGENLIIKEVLVREDIKIILKKKVK